ncbi:MAG: hypothetical protein RLZZ205_913 [Bacteroidota bacterium]
MILALALEETEICRMKKIKSSHQVVQFNEVIAIIQQSRSDTLQLVNKHLIQLYWEIGKYVHIKITQSEWGVGVVSELAQFIQKNEPNLKGFSDKNIWRMRQFYECYKDFPKLSPLVRETTWTNNLIIFSRCESLEEKEFYLRLTIQEHYNKRELERQISASLFERTMISEKGLPVSREKSGPKNVLKDSYVFEFLNLPDAYNERDLQKGLMHQMKNFILEIGKDFVFMGEQYRLQVGKNDFFIDILFYQRDLQCLVAFELKAESFKPEHLGQLNFYLEALDRDVKKPHENPSIGILLCKDKDLEVVEYALSRSLSPALIARYKTHLPNKQWLQKKLHALFNES